MAPRQTSRGSYFLPKGDVSEWQILYARLSMMQPGELLSYDQLDELLGRDFRSNRAPIYRATQELQKLNRRTVIAVAGKGYRIASASEHAYLAQRHYRSSRRQIRMAVEKSSSAERSELSQEERARMDALELTLRTYASALKRIDTRNRDRESLMEDLQKKGERIRADVNAADRITELLRRHKLLPEDEKEK